MPLNRTPPATQDTAHSVTHLSAPIVQQYSSSEQDLHASSEPNTSNVVITRRPKRKRSDTVDIQMSTLMTELNLKMEQIQSTVEEIKCQNADIKSSVEFLSQKYEDLSTQIKDLKLECSSYKNTITALEDKIERMEGSSRSTCLEIRNVPVAKSETKINLLNTISDIGKVLSVDINAQNVKDIFRIGTKNPANKTVIVELTSVLTKEKILNMYKEFNKGNNKLNTDHLKLKCPSTPIFLSENLTPKKKRLFYLARTFAHTNEIKYCWVSNGKIFIREKDGAPLHMIKEEADLKGFIKLT